jgi:hypothetical protein
MTMQDRIVDVSGARLDIIEPPSDLPPTVDEATETLLRLTAPAQVAALDPDTVTDADERNLTALLAEWGPGEKVTVDALRVADGVVWQAIQAHTTQGDWTPAKAPALWRRWRDKTAAPAPWVQPDSTNPYRLGDLVTYQGGIWRSEHDANVWPPGTGALWTRIGDA